MEIDIVPANYSGSSGLKSKDEHLFREIVDMFDGAEDTVSSTTRYITDALQESLQSHPVLGFLYHIKPFRISADMHYNNTKGLLDKAVRRFHPDPSLQQQFIDTAHFEWITQSLFQTKNNILACSAEIMGQALDFGLQFVDHSVVPDYSDKRWLTPAEEATKKTRDYFSVKVISNYTSSSVKGTLLYVTLRTLITTRKDFFSIPNETNPNGTITRCHWNTRLRIPFLRIVDKFFRMTCNIENLEDTYIMLASEQTLPRLLAKYINCLLEK